VTNSVGQVIEASHYNALADLCNKCFADVYTGRVYDATFSGSTLDNASNCNAIFSIHETDYPSASPGAGPFSLTTDVISTDFIIVVVGQEAKVGSGYSIDYAANTITFTTAVPAATRVVVFNRYTHRFGYGNSAVINNLAAGVNVESVHTNSLIDRSNAILTHVGDSTQLANVSVGTDITANDGNYIENVYQTNVLLNDVHLTVGASAASETNAGNFVRTAAWDSNLEGIFAYTFTNYSQARYFFNSGGEIRFSLDMTGNAANAGYASWKTICTDLGVVRMNHEGTLQSGSGGISNGKGFYHLTTDWQTIFSSASPGGGGGYGGGYANLRAVFHAKYVEVGSTHQIQIKVVMDDGSYHANPITGSTTFFAKTLQPNNISKNSVTYSVTGPTVSVIENFNSANDI
jgi:hypothetical protein|tara:strand:+ start:206 stop:1417 length:1212 start_codon:yes stop_codon:yes gene_type:complete